jgi:hypothetical protein
MQKSLHETAENARAVHFSGTLLSVSRGPQLKSIKSLRVLWATSIMSLLESPPMTMMTESEITQRPHARSQFADKNKVNQSHFVYWG